MLAINEQTKELSIYVEEVHQAYLFEQLTKEGIPDKNKTNVWDKSVKVEENAYYWKKSPVVSKGIKTTWDAPIVVELFCGCGGTSTGFKMAGYEIAVGCDIHQPSIATFKTNHPEASTILGDIRKVEPEQILKLLNGKHPDVLIGGVPCQGFSLNNRKRHNDDERNLLYLEFIRFIKVLNPKVIILENVSGMKSTGDFVSQIHKEIEEAGKMKVSSALLYAQDYGVPQKRTRLVFVGVKNNQNFNFNDIKKTHGNDAKLSPYIDIRSAIGDLPSLMSNESSSEYASEPFTEYQVLMRSTNTKLTNHKAPNHPSDTILKIKETAPGEPMYPRFKQRIRLAWDILSPTQVSGGIRPQFQLGHPSDSRGLTIRERCRLQSFPDNFIVTGGIVQGRVQTGNAVPPLLAKAIALAVRKYL